MSKMVRTIFDVDTLAVTMLEPIFRPTDILLAALPVDFAANLDPAMSQEPLGTIAIQYRQCPGILSQGNPVGADGGYSAAFWTHGHSYINQGRLVNHHLSSQVLLQSAQGRGPVTTLFWQTQSSLSLGLLLFVAYFSGDARVAGQNLLDVVPMLLSQFWVVLSSALLAWKMVEDLDSKANRLLRPLDALLWAAFQGAQHEQRSGHKTPHASTGRFGEMFAAQARRIGLMSWPEVRPRLERFVYSDYVQPHGGTWVDGLILKLGHSKDEGATEAERDGRAFKTRLAN
jgi:hypothetical protein